MKYKGVFSEGPYGSVTDRGCGLVFAGRLGRAAGVQGPGVRHGVMGPWLRQR